MHVERVLTLVARLYIAQISKNSSITRSRASASILKLFSTAVQKLVAQ